MGGPRYQSGGPEDDIDPRIRQTGSYVRPPEPILDPNGMLNPGLADWYDDGAMRLMGELTRSQWTDWANRFAPYIDKLTGMATDAARPEEAAQRAMSTVGNSFDGARMGLELDESRMGLSISPEERNARDRSFALAQAGSKVNAANSARAAMREQQDQILAGGASLGQVGI